MLEHAVRDHVHARGIDAQLVGQPPPPVLGVHDDRVEAVVQPPLRRALARPGLARQDVVGGDHEWATGGCSRPPSAAERERQQATVEVLHGEPLEVHDVGRPRGAAVAQHVGHVLGELDRAASASVGDARGETVEQLAARVALGRRHRTVREVARVQLDVGVRPPPARGRARGRTAACRRRGRRCGRASARGT